MAMTRCIRCGGADIYRGRLPIGSFPYTDEIIWKSESPEMIEDERIVAILCKSCGHIELIAESNLIGQKVQQKCPFCKAQYAYRLPTDTYEKTVECQNCGKKFVIKIDDVLDEIEKEFED